MSILVSTFQITGCILYCGSEAYDGFKHVPLVSTIMQLSTVVIANVIVNPLTPESAKNQNSRKIPNVIL